MSLRLGGHLIVLVITVGLVALLTLGFVRDNLGGDFIGFVEDADGTDHPYYQVGSIALLFSVLTFPAVLLGALSWELVLRAWIALCHVRGDR